MEQFGFTAHPGFDILKLRGDIKVGALPALSPALGDHLTGNPQKHLVLDFSESAAVDGSIAKLFVNIQKRLTTNGKKLYVLHAGGALLPLLRGAGLTDELQDIHELEREIGESRIRACLPYTYEELTLKRLRCGCSVCGSKNVAGYLLDSSAYEWSWRDDDFFPSCSDRAGEKFDYFATLPIVCLDCYFVATDIGHFHLLDSDGAIAQQATLPESAKINLSKNIKKRRKIIESCPKADDPHFFLYPRVRTASYYLYLLAEASIRTLALNKADADPFMVGFLNYWAIRYADNGQKGALIDNCRTWLTQAMHEGKIASHPERAQAFFILFAAALTLDRVKEANAIQQDFSAMMETISYSKTTTATISSPLFWFNQVQKLWRREIEKKSSALAKGGV